MQHYIDDPKLYKIFANPFFWRKKSEEMRRSAEVLKTELDRQINYLANHRGDKKFDFNIVGALVGDTCFAMYGFSIECLLKGVIIWQYPEYTSGGKTAKNLKSHDLLKLALMAKIDLSHDETMFCTNATRYMMQFRYPIPNSMEETQYTMVVGTISYFDVFQGLFDKLYSLIKGFNITGHDEDRCPKCIARKSVT